MTRDKILVMLDSKVISSQICQRVESQLSLKPQVVRELRDAERVLAQSADELVAAIVNPTFGNICNRQAIDAVLHHQVPCLVVTGSFSEDARDDFLRMGVLDYFLKDARLTDNVVRTLKRLIRNLSTRVLVVDDSRVTRDYHRQLLELQNCQVSVACDGREAMEILATHNDVRLVLTDYEMPRMDGVELTQAIRKTHDQDDIAIIGLSSSSDRSSLSAEFLKNGANDFLPKSFLPEEFHCRIGHSLELLEHIAALRQARTDAEALARTDGLTGVNNRRAFMDTGDREIDRARRKKLPMSVMLLDIDHFKKINDVHGHATGDTALQYLTRTVTANLRKYDIFGRLGGEEFGALFPETDVATTVHVMDRLRETLSGVVIPTEAGGTLQLTVSIGVANCDPREQSLADALRHADAALYAAKRGGRNRVVLAGANDVEPPALNRSA